MKNSEVQSRGLRAVQRYEARRGRIALPSGCVGFDLCSRGRGGVRHIEVKTTQAQNFTWRWLEEAEYRSLEHDRRFYLYLVTNVRRGHRATVMVLTPGRVKKLFVRKETKYLFDLRPCNVTV